MRASEEIRFAAPNIRFFTALGRLGQASEW
jgi:hypothetical protein